MDATQSQRTSFKERAQEASQEAAQRPKEDRGDGKGTSDPAPIATALAPSPPPSSTSSPSHEFSFTISLHPSPTSTPSTIRYSKTTPSFAIDLAPADDIFFHGHLLPLHLLSHPAIAPRPSDISIENLSLPLDRVDLEQQSQGRTHAHNHDDDTNRNETKERSKPKSLSSLFFGKWLKGGDGRDREEDKKKKKKGFDVARILRKYLSAVEPFFFSFKGEKEKRDLRRRPYSFSVRSHSREREGWKKRRGEFSAPASMRTSPTNSGLLVATSATFSSSDESTMEELQNAIQAAIAHCKSSIAMKEEKLKR